MDPLVDVANDLTPSVVDYSLFELNLQERRPAQAQSALKDYHERMSLLDYHVKNRVSRPRVGAIGGRR